MSKWPMVPLVEVLSKSEDQTDILPDQTYKEVTVRLWGKGVILRREASGVEIAAARRLLVTQGQLILSKIDARNGAIGLVPPELNGAVVSNDFPVYNTARSRLIPGFLNWLTKTSGFVDLCRAASEGTTNRVRLKEDRFLQMKIPLPPLSEQQRIVEWLDAVATRVEEAKRLVGATNQGMDNLCRSLLWSTHPEGIKPTQMSELVRQREPDVEVLTDGSYDFAGVYCFGRGVFRGQTRSGMDFQYPRLTRLRAGDFVYPKLMAWEGAMAVVPPECDGLVVSTEYPVFEIDDLKVLPEVLDIYFRTPSVWPEISGSSTGTNVRRRRLNPKDFLRHQFPLPPMSLQRRVREVKARTEEAKQSRKQNAEELDAILDSVLNQLFDCGGSHD